MSRLIVKNLPKHLKEVDLQRHFESNKTISCTVTDAKIMLKNNRSRLFGFVGFKNEQQAHAALKYFNNSYLHTSRIQVALAKAQDDETLDRPWSKHSIGSSAFQRNNPTKVETGQKKRDKKAEEHSKVEIEEKKRKFREFLKLSEKNGTKQGWNDQFESFMQVDEKLKKKDSKIKDKETTDKPDSQAEKIVEPAVKENFVDEKRLYVMNLSYTVTKEELQNLFGKYGEIQDIEIPFRKGGRGTPLGLGFVRFTETEAAIQAFAELDKSYFQGRKIHIKPAEKKPVKIEEPYVRPEREDRVEARQSNYKKEKE